MSRIDSNVITVKNFKSLHQNKQVEVLKNFLKTLKSADGVGKKSFERLKTFAKMYHLLPSIEAKCEVIEGIDHKIEILMRENKRYQKSVDGIVDSDPNYYARPAEPFVKELEKKINSNCKLIDQLRYTRYLTQLVEFYLRENKLI